MVLAFLPQSVEEPTKGRTKTFFRLSKRFCMSIVKICMVQNTPTNGEGNMRAILQQYGQEFSKRSIGAGNSDNIIFLWFDSVTIFLTYLYS